MIKKILCMVLAAVLCVGAVSTVLVGCNNTGDTGNGEKVKLYVADKITDQTGINSWLQQRQDAFDEQFGDRIEVAFARSRRFFRRDSGGYAAVYGCS